MDDDDEAAADPAGEAEGVDVAALFDRAAPTYDAVGVDWFGPIAADLVAALDLRRGERAVDLGCGRGAVLRLLAGAVVPDGHVLGLDLAPGMAQRTAADVRHVAHVSVALADVADPPLTPNSVDVLTASLVLFFFPEPDRVLRRWAGALRSGGQLGVTTLGAQDARWDAVDDLFRPHLPSRLRDAVDRVDDGPFADDASVAALLRGAGLEDVHVTTTVHAARFVDVEQWRRWSWSHGQRALWEAVPPERHDDVLADVARLFASWQEGDEEPALRQEVRTATARRP